MANKINDVRVDVTPDAPVDEQPVIGLIGMGEMGRMYAQHLSQAGWKKYAHCVSISLEFSSRRRI